MDRKNKNSDSEKEKKIHASPDPVNGGDGEEKNNRRNEERRRADRRQIFRRAVDVQNAMNGEPESQLARDLKKEIETRDAELENLKNEIESFKDLIQRRQADFENYKKRMIKFQEDQKKFAIKDFALEIIYINDDLLRAIEASSNIEVNQSLEESHKSFVDGVSMISNRIEGTLNKFGIAEIDAMNEVFDPNFHEAVEIESTPEFDMDTVTKVYQKGFRIDDIVIRSAKVRVAKPMKETPAEKDGSGAEEKTEKG